jgi:hypothetical protein
MRSPSRSTTRQSLVALGCILTAAGASAQWGGGMKLKRYRSTGGADSSQPVERVETRDYGQNQSSRLTWSPSMMPSGGSEPLGM